MTDLEKEVLRQIHELAHEVITLRRRVSEMEYQQFTDCNEQVIKQCIRLALANDDVFTAQAIEKHFNVSL
jgi:hypothetical protein